MRPLIVVEGPDAAVGEALREVRDAGWTLQQGWSPPPGSGRIVCTGAVHSAENAAAALLAVVSGAGLVVAARAERDVIDRLCDDLRRLGRLDHRIGDAPRGVGLTRDERALVESLLRGLTLGEAARKLNLSRRTADRRLASARRKLGAGTTAEALVEFARRA